MSLQKQETVIRALIDEWYGALARGDAPGLAKHYADDVRIGSLASPLWLRGKQKYIESMTWWFGTFSEPLRGEAEDLSIVAGEDVAFVNGFTHIVGRKKEGYTMEFRARLTLCLEKRDRAWTVVAEHVSVPFDMQSFKPLMDLTE
jgi:uncharacterized protein (TIGR02246 family)